ncbi:Uncharacterised protein [Pantoea agglomerans]|uniref:Uncharacterized protein n=1 Tax=Enterobacter agglomerans TaxID=549 RepID=A0A379AD00_ENTAG|nr:Uncharacterised protein [Pantoea agglomerans]
MNAKPAAAPAPHPFTLQLALGLVGVLIAAPNLRAERSRQ